MDTSLDGHDFPPPPYETSERYLDQKADVSRSIADPSSIIDCNEFAAEWEEWSELAPRAAHRSVSRSSATFASRSNPELLHGPSNNPEHGRRMFIANLSREASHEATRSKSSVILSGTSHSRRELPIASISPEVHEILQENTAQPSTHPRFDRPNNGSMHPASFPSIGGSFERSSSSSSQRPSAGIYGAQSPDFSSWSSNASTTPPPSEWRRQRQHPASMQAEHKRALTYPWQFDDPCMERETLDELALYNEAVSPHLFSSQMRPAPLSHRHYGANTSTGELALSPQSVHDTPVLLQPGAAAQDVFAFPQTSVPPASTFSAAPRLVHHNMSYEGPRLS